MICEFMICRLDDSPHSAGETWSRLTSATREQNGGDIMLKALLARAHQKHRTVGFPKQPPVLPDRFRGRPQIDSAKCPDGCRVCAEVCPTDAISDERQERAA